MSSDSINNDTCANCGKSEESSGDLKACTACKLVKYCNRDCQIAYRPQHKKACKKRAAELHEIKLFKQPPHKEDCPICMLRLPTLGTGCRYKVCCGKVICSGCIHAPVYDYLGNEVDNTKCPFCRTPKPTSDEEELEMTRKRVEAGDAEAFNSLGMIYWNGDLGVQQDRARALELYNRAAELGNTWACNNIAVAYFQGNYVEGNEKKAQHYYELAVIGGLMTARHLLGNTESRTGNMDRALKHYIIAAAFGYNESLEEIQKLYAYGHATKDDYENALRLYQAYLDEIKSPQRDEAASVSDQFKYY